MSENFPDKSLIVRFEVAGLPSGTYLCRLSAGSEVDHELLTLIR